jgi:hypothetical protein
MLPLEHRLTGAGFSPVEKGTAGRRFAGLHRKSLHRLTGRTSEESHMSGMSQDDDIAHLKAQASQQQDALKQIAARCGAVNYPPDLVVEIAALAQGALRQAAPVGASRERPQGEVRA